MPTTIRYAIRHQHPAVTKPHYVTRDVGLSVVGGISQYVEDAKTWATPKTAQKWMDERPEWLAYRTRNGGTVEIVPVKMGQRHKSVPVALAA